MCTHFPLATLSGLALLAGLALATTGSSARADTTVRPLPDKTWVTWEGFGASLAWWANQFGARDDLADTAFTTRTVRLTTDSGTYNVPGLGLNIARYNIGGTSNAPAGGAHADIPATMPAFKQIQGFWLDWTSDDPASASFDWNVDATQRAMLKKAAARGADRIEAFSDAPMWWMLYNHSTAGSATGGDNLQSWNYQAFAKYLATVARYARDNWGVDFETVEAFNEPSAWWWKYPSSQEGCHFDIATQKQVLAYLRTELDSRGLADVAISASDENSVDDALNTWNAFDTVTRAKVDRINVHGYSGLAAYRGPNRAPLYLATSSSGKRLWNSEYGESDGKGLTMAESLVLDINEMHVSGWVYWQPFDSGGWGLVQANAGDNWIGPPNPKYYVLAQFSRHIRPGMAILESGDANTVAAYDPVAHTLVLVTFSKADQWVSYDLTSFRAASGPVSRWTTATDGSTLYARSADAALSGSAFRAWCAANTVQTFEVKNVYRWYEPVRRVNAGGPAVGPFEADAGFSGGGAQKNLSLVDTTDPAAAPPAVYRSLRTGAFTCTLDGLSPNAPYQVRLHFAETLFSEAGKRQFHVDINGARVLTNFDIVAEAGAPNRALVRAFAAQSDAGGRITVAFTRGAADNPMVSGLEVLLDPLAQAYTVTDLVRALHVASGGSAVQGLDMARLDVGSLGEAGHIDMSDAVTIARKLTGLDANP